MRSSFSSSFATVETSSVSTLPAASIRSIALLAHLCCSSLLRALTLPQLRSRSLFQSRRVAFAYARDEPTNHRFVADTLREDRCRESICETDSNRIVLGTRAHSADGGVNAYVVLRSFASCRSSSLLTIVGHTRFASRTRYISSFERCYRAKRRSRYTARTRDTVSVFKYLVPLGDT